jgi:glycosyltransferase involved in cell wall biosynthesis
MSRPLRIVLVADTFAPGTDVAAETAREICDALLAAGHEVLVLTSTGGNRSYRSAEVLRTRKVPPMPAIRTRVSAFSPDAVQVVRPRALGTTAMRALEHTGVPLFVLDPGPLHPRVGTVLSSTRAGARLLGMVGVDARVWPPGVRVDDHHPGLRSADLHDAWARATSAEGPRVVVGYAGPVGAATTKSVRRLVRIAEHDALRLVVLGRGSGTATLKQAGARIVGACGGLELARGLASLDVFVQPRKHESGLPVIRKALASGVPVVAFETAANAEVVTSGRNGMLVAPGQGRGALRDAVARLAADPEGRAELAAHARPSVAGRTWADAVADLVGIYGPLRVAV